MCQSPLCTASTHSKHNDVGRSVSEDTAVGDKGTLVTQQLEHLEDGEEEEEAKEAAQDLQRKQTKCFLVNNRISLRGSHLQNLKRHVNKSTQVMDCKTQIIYPDVFKKKSNTHIYRAIYIYIYIYKIF